MDYDLIIIGAGPGGYVAAIRAAQLGMNVLITDKRPVAGGTCLNVGCIPSKALLHSSYKYWSAKNEFDKYGIEIIGTNIDFKKLIGQKDAVVKDLTSGIGFLFKKNKITFVSGETSLVKQNDGSVAVTVKDEKETEKTYTAPSIIIATGSKPVEIPALPFDEISILSSTGALSLQIPPQHLVVVGGGYIGLELGSVWNRLGSQVTVVEAAEDIALTMDRELGIALRKSLASQGISFKVNRKVLGAKKNGDTFHLEITATNEVLSRAEMLSCDAILVAVGRKPCIDGLKVEEVGLTLTDRGFIQVDKDYKTNLPGVYALGDVIGGMMLAHKAEEEGIALVESLAGQAGHVNYNVIPAVIFTQPEVASVGITEEEAKNQGIDYKVGKFPFAANSLAKALLHTEGFVKIIADNKTDRVLGVHIIGAQAGAMIAEAAIAMEYQASSEDIARTCHAHPTYSEALKEAAWDTFATALHK